MTSTEQQQERVFELITGYMASRAIGAAVRLRVPEILGDGERTAADVARESGAQPQAVHRLLRALAALRLADEPAAGRFSLTPAGAALRPGAPGSLSALAEMFTDPAMMRGWGELEGSVRTGEVGFDRVFGKDFFGYLQDHPELSACFNAAMSEGTRGIAPLLPAAYDFARHRTVLDIGGGDATLLAPVLRAHPGLRGVVYDQAEGHAQAGATLEAAGVADRCTLATGDFFTSVPEGADLHLIKSVLHDWSDERCATILGHSRRALPADGRLLILELVLPETVGADASPLTYLTDLNMLVNVGGRERTRAEFEELCRGAGFTVTGVTPLAPPSPFCLIEAVPG